MVLMDGDAFIMNYGPELGDSGPEPEPSIEPSDDKPVAGVKRVYRFFFGYSRRGMPFARYIGRDRFEGCDNLADGLADSVTLSEENGMSELHNIMQWAKYTEKRLGAQGDYKTAIEIVLPSELFDEVSYQHDRKAQVLSPRGSGSGWSLDY